MDLAAVALSLGRSESAAAGLGCNGVSTTTMVVADCIAYDEWTVETRNGRINLSRPFLIDGQNPNHDS
uniref:Uncharacterized protein n=1 Tax=Oryza rufipogon TaxID=4529 RepID=A0A0E0MVP5_ORYRU